VQATVRVAEMPKSTLPVSRPEKMMPITPASTCGFALLSQVANATPNDIKAQAKNSAADA
jgi:hypothetical protein